jgi:hypothetical protein
VSFPEDIVSTKAYSNLRGPKKINMTIEREEGNLRVLRIKGLADLTSLGFVRFQFSVERKDARG